MYILPLLAFLGHCWSVQASELLIGAFNIRVFGQSKVEKQDVVTQLVKIISRYDLVLIQEIRDKSGTAILELFEQVNRANDNAYAYAISDRLGRTNSKEQYSFFYKTKYFTKVDEYTYRDPKDVFEREPYNVRFDVSDWGLPDLVVSAIHTKPDDAVAELSRMVDVYEDIVDRWDIENVLILGDFNADCTYVRKSQWPEVQLRTDQRFQWYINDEADTTVTATDCAYDRFAIAGKGLQDAVHGAKVFDFQGEYGLSQELAEDISDHFPIELTIFGKPGEYVTDDNSGNHGNHLTRSVSSWFFVFLGSLCVSQ